MIAQAIKFTKTEGKREISVSLGASLDPSIAFHDLGVTWFSNETPHAALDKTGEVDSSKDEYIYFVVKDTGQGLDRDEISRLSARFYQASPKTHIHVSCPQF